VGTVRKPLDPLGEHLYHEFAHSRPVGRSDVTQKDIGLLRVGLLQELDQEPEGLIGEVRRAPRSKVGVSAIGHVADCSGQSAGDEIFQEGRMGELEAIRLLTHDHGGVSQVLRQHLWVPLRFGEPGHRPSEPQVVVEPTLKPVFEFVGVHGAFRTGPQLDRQLLHQPRLQPLGNLVLLLVAKEPALDQAVIEIDRSHRMAEQPEPLDVGELSGEHSKTHRPLRQFSQVVDLTQ
jgi:hypothetical protein